MPQDENFEALMRSVAPEQTQAVNAEMVTTEVREEATQTNQAQPESEVQTEMVSTQQETNELGAPNNEVVTEQNNTASVNFDEWLKNETEGLFENVESFKQNLVKFKEYDEKVAKIGELEKTQLPDDAFVKKLAEMRNNGASKDQINQFIKLNNEYDDFSSLSPRDLKIAKLVLIDGYSEATAGRKVDKDFPLNDYEEDTDEYQDLFEEQTLSAKSDLQQLEAFKAKISTVENKAEQQKLEQIALQSAHESNIKSIIPNIITEFKGLGSLELSGKVGKEDVTSNLSFDYDDEFAKKIPSVLEYFFNQEIAPVTQEKIQEAKNYINAMYLVENWQKISKDIYLNALSIAAEKADNKYVNNKEIKENDPNPAPQQGGVTPQQWNEFANRVFGGRV